MTSFKRASIRFFTGVVLSILAQHTPGQEPEQISKSIAELNAPQFAVRDQATQDLIAAGAPAVEALERALSGATLEVAARAVFVLQELALSGQTETEDAAYQLLEDVARARLTPPARRAQDALERIGLLRQERAFAELERLGAKVDPTYVEFGMIGARGWMAIEFDEEFRGTEKDLSRLKWLRDVQQVSFVGPQITDRWIQHVEGMPGVYFVKIANANITNDALRHLRYVSRLQVVKLIYVSVGDQAIEHFSNCQHLQRVIAYGTGITNAVEERLNDNGVNIDLKRGAFLGITVTGARNGAAWDIDKVEPNSAAEKAGLKRHDVIVEYDGQPVPDFDALLKLIAANAVGETVTLKVRRAGKILEKEVTFGNWR